MVIEKILKLKGIIILLGIFIAGNHAVLNAQDFSWGQCIRGIDSDIGYGVAADTSGNVYITGIFRGVADFNVKEPGVHTLTSSGGYDVYLSKYDTGGNLIWAQSMGGLGDDFGIKVDVDQAGNVYVVGIFRDSADFDLRQPGIHTLLSFGHNDAFIAKYDTGGNCVWVQNMGGRSSDRGYGLSVDHAGNAYVTGAFYDTVEFDSKRPGVHTIASSGSVDVFLAKYDTDGNCVWAKGIGGSKVEYGFAVAVERTGYVYITGYFSDTADFDPGPGVQILVSTGSHDIFLAKYDTAGNYIWAKNMGGALGGQGEEIAIDRTGNVYITGHFGGSSIDFDPGPGTQLLIPTGGIDIFLAKYDTSGNYMWAKSIGGTGTDQGMDVAVDRVGNVYATGYFTGTANFDTGSSNAFLTSRASDTYIAKYNTDGNFIWVGKIGGASSDRGNGVTVDRRGNVFIAGNFWDVADFDPGPDTATFTSKGNGDAFVVKLACNDTSSFHLSVEECESGNGYTLNGEVYVTSGIYTQIFPTTAGCDSTITLDLTIISIEKPFINVDNFLLGVAGTYATYQWIKDGVLIPGATDSTYAVIENGDYQVIVTNEYGCADTSDVYAVTNVAVSDLHSAAKHIRIYPNPATGLLYINSPVEVHAYISSIEGRNILSARHAKVINVSSFTQGIYLLRITDIEGRLIKMEKVVVKE